MSLLIEGISQYFKPGVLYGSTVTAPVLLLVVLLTALGYCFWWRSCESARASKFSRSASRSDAASSSLPSPAAVLPRWLGLVGGHTLQITSEQVSLQPQCGPKSFLWVPLGTTSSNRRRIVHIYRVYRLKRETRREESKRGSWVSCTMYPR